MKTLQNTLWLALIALMFSSCSNTYTINDLFEMEGCSGPCYKQMPCEGQDITVSILLDGSNTMRNGNMYFVRDNENFQRTIKVEFDESVSMETQDLLEKSVNKTATIRGSIEGYDLLNPEKCKRAHIIYVRNDGDVSIR